MVDQPSQKPQSQKNSLMMKLRRCKTHKSLVPHVLICIFNRLEITSSDEDEKIVRKDKKGKKPEMSVRSVLSQLYTSDLCCYLVILSIISDISDCDTEMAEPVTPTRKR